MTVKGNKPQQNGIFQIIPVLFMSFSSLRPGLLFPYIDNLFVFCGNGMVESMLEPHLKAFPAMATQLQVSITFLLLGASYMVTAPAAGWVQKRIIKFNESINKYCLK